jgi:hypothetical protein
MRSSPQVAISISKLVSIVASALTSSSISTILVKLSIKLVISISPSVYPSIHCSIILVYISISMLSLSFINPTSIIFEMIPLTISNDELLPTIIP